MSAIEHRARELLAAEYVAQGRCEPSIGSPAFDVHIASLRAIIAALTPPEAWVLVPVEPTAEMIVAAWRYGDGDDAPDPVYSWRAMLAARPEVKP